jgi:hypothetical protein
VLIWNTACDFFSGCDVKNVKGQSRSNDAPTFAIALLWANVASFPTTGKGAQVHS